MFCSFETIRKIPQILQLFKHLEDFIQKRIPQSLTVENFQTNSRHSAAIYNELSGKIERSSKLIDLILVKLATAASIISPLLIAFINYFVLGLGNESFRFDAIIWLPFDANQPIGLFVALLFQNVSIYATVCFFTPIVCVFIGSCWSIVTFLKDIARYVHDLRKKKILKLNKHELTERIRDFVRFHAEVEELSETFFW